VNEEIRNIVREELASAFADRRAARKVKTHLGIPWVGILSIAAVVMIPLLGWTMSLSNRVAVLEAQSLPLQSAAAEIAALKQEITDFRNSFDEWKQTQHSVQNKEK
jgi:hypothetical protein